MAESVFKQVGKYYFSPAPIAKGSFGTIHKGYDTTNQDTRLAVKCINIQHLLASDIERDMVLREADILAKIKGEHIVEFVDKLQTTHNLYIFMKFCDGGDLETKIRQNCAFTEEEACSIIKQIAKAFVDLENLDNSESEENKISIIHRDIKPANILFHEGKVKLADFGFAKIIDDVDKNVKKRHTTIGTSLYSAPQILNVKKFSSKCDVWSAGIIFYELLFKKVPWVAQSEAKLLMSIEAQPLVFSETVQIKKETEDLIRKMLELEEEDRVSWKEVYEHPALKNCNC